MKHHIEHKNVAPNRKEHIQTLCEQYLAALQKHLQVFPSDAAEEYMDLLAEQVVQLGGMAEGTIQVATKHTDWVAV